MPDIFIDRDGVINENREEHVKSWEEFKFLPGSKEALVRLSLEGYRIFVITNQAAINRGLLTQATLHDIHHRLMNEVIEAGGLIEAILFCPHCPEEACLCRKPQPGLLEQAARLYQANLSGSWLIGDHLNDILAGEQVGCRTMLVLTGRGANAYKQYQFGLTRPQTQITKDLSQAVEIILKVDRARSTLVEKQRGAYEEWAS